MVHMCVCARATGRLVEEGGNGDGKNRAHNLNGIGNGTNRAHNGNGEQVGREDARSAIWRVRVD